MENPFEENKPQRPVLLTVICILTFIGSGWNVLSNLFSLFSGNRTDSSIQIEQYSSWMGEAEGGNVPAFLSRFLHSSIEVMQAMAEHAHEIALMSLVLGVVSVLGAILMFQLRRPGFYLYTTAQLLALFVLPYFAGFSLFVVLGMCWAALISAIFVVLYAVNLKYMK